MAGFTNTSIIAPRSKKPHIVLRGNYWRVSPLHDKVKRSPTCVQKWLAAHNTLCSWNAELRSNGDNKSGDR